MAQFQPLTAFKILVILGHSNEGNPQEQMTFDGEVRARAGGVLYQQKKIKKIVLEGGGNDEKARIAEAQRMKRYLVEQFEVPKEAIEIDSRGTNTLENIANFIGLLREREIEESDAAFLTNGYNVVRLNLVLEFLGWSQPIILSAERVLMGADDKLTKAAGDYLESQEYQNRLDYESYWIARTIYDKEYTRAARKQLGIKQTPIEYFQSQPRREMENYG